MGFNLDSVGVPVDEGRHARGTETNASVVKIFSVYALQALASVLVAIGTDTGFEGAVTALFFIGLVGPIEVVFRCYGWGRVCPVARTALP